MSQVPAGATIAVMRKRWLAPAGLVLLSIVPMAGGAFRLADLADGGATAENARFFAAPIPVVLHIFAAIAYSLLGAWQFALTRQHKVVGRIVAPCGLLVALTGLWMTLFHDVPDGPLLAVFRLLFGTAMAVSIVLGFVTVRRRQFERHRAWMIRGYALGIAAGTQAVVTILWMIPLGNPTGLTSELLLGAGWMINVIVAELIIARRNPLRRTDARNSARLVRVA
jgi:Predicted membrane protein (DUF2306)